MIEVLDAGPLTTVQDLGRPGWAHLGVPRSGAADRGAVRLANRLAGNPEGAAALETSLAGPRLRIHHDCVVVLAGAPCPAAVAGRELALHQATRLAAGDELIVGRAQRGARTYIAFAGGIDAPPTLGSRATDTLAGLGPAPLRAGDRLALGDPYGRPPAVDVVPVPEPAGEVEVALLLGPRDDWLAAGALDALHAAAYTVDAASNRVGVRLTGPRLHWARPQELRSEGIVPGAVQVPPSGQPIVLLADHPTTGGYPVVGVVAERALDRVAQLRPGDRIRLRPVPNPV
ncbi:MAG TPA: biotin-dependent carboxyltransferase family protein [Solirubrobacteraceae bacterium]|nr:biotin-dependent carboxyltransferase family protein [Solirubrobacteraceae bacterium]